MPVLLSNDKSLNVQLIYFKRKSTCSIIPQSPLGMLILYCICIDLKTLFIESTFFFYSRTLPDYPNEQKYNAKPVTPVSHSTNSTNNNTTEKKVHIKKPLNAFMLYMKEMRAKVVAECTLKESAAINQILGRRVSHRIPRPPQMLNHMLTHLK